MRKLPDYKDVYLPSTDNDNDYMPRLIKRLVENKYETNAVYLIQPDYLKDGYLDASKKAQKIYEEYQDSLKNYFYDEKEDAPHLENALYLDNVETKSRKEYFTYENKGFNKRRTYGITVVEHRASFVSKNENDAIKSATVDSRFAFINGPDLVLENLKNYMGCDFSKEVENEILGKLDNFSKDFNDFYISKNTPLIEDEFVV